jgi:hypothetical protein
MDKVVALAKDIGRSPVQIALRWLIQQRVVTIPVFSARTLDQAKEDLGACDFVLTPEQMAAIDQATAAAIASVMPEAGPYPYPMLEYGTPALPGFYSRALLWGNTEYAIDNHRRAAPPKFRPKPTDPMR